MGKFQILWSPGALQDLENIYLFYAEENINAAVKIHNTILDEVALLAEYPLLGKPTETFKNRRKSYRELVLLKGEFIALYFLENENIFIAGLWNCRENYQKSEL